MAIRCRSEHSRSEWSEEGIRGSDGAVRRADHRRRGVTNVLPFTPKTGTNVTVGIGACADDDCRAQVYRLQAFRI